MNVYLLTRIGTTDYDEFDSFVVISNTEEQAKNYRPDGSLIGSDEEEKYGSWVPKSKVDCKLIGTALDDTKEGDIICASFNAG